MRYNDSIVDRKDFVSDINVIEKIRYSVII